MIDQIRNLKPGEVLWDKGERASVKGLHVRANPSGEKSFLLYYVTRTGIQRRPKIGTFGPMTVADARRIARDLLDKISAGKDPMGEWKDARADFTVSEIYARAFDSHWKGMKTKWATVDVPSIYRNHIAPAFGPMKLFEVTPRRVREWHSKYRDTGPVVGNRALAVLSKLFHFAEQEEIRTQNTNPCYLIKAHPERKRNRYASEGEIRAIGPILEREEKKHPAAVAFLYLLMFSGSRPSAIERAEWDQLEEVYLNGEKYGILTFHGKSSRKTGDDEKVILPPQAMRALDRLPRIEGLTITGIKMPRRLWKKIKEEVGCSDLWARDWRRTFATVGMSNGVAMSQIGELLNHHNTQTTKNYAKLMHGNGMKAASSIANRMEELLKH